VIEGKSIDYAESDIGCASADKMDAQCRGLGAVAAKARRLFFESCLALGYWWSVIFSENRCPLFGIMLQWALGCARRGGAVFHFMLPLRELGPK